MSQFAKANHELPEWTNDTNRGTDGMKIWSADASPAML